jgi:hypothetical protein
VPHHFLVSSFLWLCLILDIMKICMDFGPDGAFSSSDIPKMVDQQNSWNSLVISTYLLHLEWNVGMFVINICILWLLTTFLVAWPRIALWSDREVRRICPMACFWSVGYKYSSISYKIWLLAISTAYLTLESPLLPHISIPWSIVGVWDSSAWFQCSWALWH